MESYSNRGSTIFYTFCSALLTSAVCCHLSAFLYDPKPLAKIEFQKFHDFTPNSYLNCGIINILIIIIIIFLNLYIHIDMI